MLQSPDTAFEIRDNQAFQTIGTVYSKLLPKERRARVRILTGPSEHVIECTRPEDLEVIANVMMRLANMLREPNDTRFDNLHTFVLAEEGCREISAAR